MSTSRVFDRVYENHSTAMRVPCEQASASHARPSRLSEEPSLRFEIHGRLLFCIVCCSVDVLFVLLGYFDAYVPRA
jgi:hypothetical protein